MEQLKCGSFTGTRQTLFDLIWKIPILEIAKRFSVSDTAIIKLCRDYCIPRPGAGYWAKVRAGKVVPARPILQEEFADDSAIKFHPVAIEWANQKYGGLDKFSKTQVERGKRILSVFLSEIQKEFAECFIFCVDGKECFGRTDTCTAIQISDSYFIVRFSSLYSDESYLSMEIRQGGAGSFLEKMVWRDTRAAKLDKKIPQAARWIISQVNHRKAQADRITEERHERDSKSAHLRALGDLAGMLLGFNEAKSIREMLSKLPANKNPRTRKWTKWAKNYADSIDPILALKMGRPVSRSLLCEMLLNRSTIHLMHLDIEGEGPKFSRFENWPPWEGSVADQNCAHDTSR